MFLIRIVSYVTSVIVLAYTMVVLYRCVCSRNYAEWRTSWSNEKNDEPVSQFVMEAVPMVLDGHCQEIECVVTDGSSVVSSCLGGQLKVWDAVTGEQLSSIDRVAYFGGNKSPDLSVDCDDSMLSDYESGSPPSRDENSMSFPSLQQKINTNFRNLKLEPVMNQRHRSFDFGEHYRQLYLNHEHDSHIRHKSSDTVRWIMNQALVNTNSQKKSPSCERLPSDASDTKPSNKLIINNSVFSECDTNNKVPSIWCMDYMDNLIVLGCSNGRLEFWEGTTGKFKVNLILKIIF